MKHTAIQEIKYWPARTRRRRFRSFWIGGLPLTRYVGHRGAYTTLIKYIYKPAIIDAIYNESVLTRYLREQRDQ